MYTVQIQEEVTLKQILQNKANIDKFYAERLSKAIVKYSNQYGIESELYTAILMQESSYQLNAISCYEGVDSKDLFNKKTICIDFGIAQINYKTIEKYQFNNIKLLKDLDYSVEAGAKVLAWFKVTYAKSEPHRWHCRYNVGTASPKKINKSCEKYLADVARWK